MEIEGKNTIKMFKTDKNGKIDKTLGTYKYKLNAITYDMEQMAIKTT